MPTPEEAHTIAGYTCLLELTLWEQYGMDVRDPLFRAQTIEPVALQVTPKHRLAHPEAQSLPRGATLHAIRETRQWSLRQTSEQLFHQTGLHVTHQYLSKVEREEVTPSPQLLEALAATLQQPAVLPSDSESERSKGTLDLSQNCNGEYPSGATFTPPWRDHLHQATQKLLIAEQARTRALAAAHEAGLSLREIATATGLSPSGVRKLINAPQGTDPD